MAATGLTRASTYYEDATEHGPGSRQLVLVEADGRDAEACEILLRAGAEGLDERGSGVGVAHAHLRREDVSALRERPQEEQHPHGGA